MAWTSDNAQAGSGIHLAHMAAREAQQRGLRSCLGALLTKCFQQVPTMKICFGSPDCSDHLALFLQTGCHLQLFRQQGQRLQPLGQAVFYGEPRVCVTASGLQ